MSRNILIALSDRRLLTSYYQSLSKIGLDVGIATDGLDCVAQMRRALPEILVLDPDLLWGGGDGVLSVLHDDERLARTQVLVLPARPQSVGLQRVTRFPAVKEYLLSPLPPPVLAERLQSLLGHGQPGKCAGFPARNP